MERKINRQQNDDDQIRYLQEWKAKKKIRDEEKANKKQRHKEARRRFCSKFTGGRRP